LEIHIETQTITGTPSSISFNNVFSSNFKSYLILSKVKFGTENELNLRLRAAGTDTTSSTYSYQRISAGSTTISAGSATATALFTSRSDTGAESITQIIVHNPFLSENTTFWTSGGYSVNIQLITGFQSGSTSYDGFTLIAAGNFASGQISVYGYKD
jgi:hypothetical protein